MDELDLLDPELYCCYVHTCFDNSVKYGDHSKDYYEKVILMRMNENVIAEAAGIDCQHCAYFGCTHAWLSCTQFISAASGRCMQVVVISPQTSMEQVERGQRSLLLTL